MRRASLILLALFLVLGFTACGDDDDDTAGTDTSETTEADQTTTSESTTTTAESTTTTAGGGDADVAVADTPLGEVLVDADGRTLYGFMNDSAGTPTCTGGCAQTWPAATVDGAPQADAAIGQGVITTVDGPGGTQLKAGDWPLYRFSGDSAPGDTNGHGVGGVWFAVAPDGSPIPT